MGSRLMRKGTQGRDVDLLRSCEGEAGVRRQVSSLAELAAVVLQRRKVACVLVASIARSKVRKRVSSPPTYERYAPPVWLPVSGT